MANAESVKVGNEFSSVEALWSQFEGVMGKDQVPEPEGQTGEEEERHGGGEEDTELEHDGGSGR